MSSFHCVSKEGCQNFTVFTENNLSFPACSIPSITAREILWSNTTCLFQTHGKTILTATQSPPSLRVSSGSGIPGCTLSLLSLASCVWKGSSLGGLHSLPISCALHSQAGHFSPALTKADGHALGVPAPRPPP